MTDEVPATLSAFRKTELYGKLSTMFANADCFFVSFPNSGRTWLRFLIEYDNSERYCAPLQIRSRNLRGFYNFGHIFFTHELFEFCA